MTEKLFATISIQERGQDEVTYNWLRAGRKRPVGDYREIIAGYETASPAQRAEMEKRVNQFFTKQEVEELRRYLRRSRGFELFASEVSLPVQPQELQAASRGTPYELWKDGDYALPFKVSAYRTFEPEPEDLDLETAPLD